MDSSAKQKANLALCCYKKGVDKKVLQKKIIYGKLYK